MSKADRRGIAKVRLLAAPLTLALAACVQPGAVPPEAGLPVPERWAETDVVPARLDVAEYWTQLDDPLLTEFVEAALENNLDLAQSAARLEQARAQLASARAGFFPQLNGSGGAQKDVGDFARDQVQFNLGLDASWEADLFGRISGNVAASRADLQAAGYSLADLQRLIVGQVALTTIQARATALQLAISRDTLKYQDDNLQIARWRNQAGLVSSLDVEQARGQRAQTAASIPLLASNLAASANAISTLIGEPPGRVLALMKTTEVLPDPPSLTAFEAPAEVLRRRPDVRGAEATLVASSARVGVARAQLLPLVRLTGNLGTAASGFDGLFEVITGGLFASVSQLIFDGGRTRAQIAGALVESLRIQVGSSFTRPDSPVPAPLGRTDASGRFVNGLLARIAEAGGVRPHPARQPHIPIWIGGHSEAALRRTVEVGDGWHPLGLRPPVSLHPPEMAARVRRLRDMATAAGRDPATITISFKAPLKFQEAVAAGRAPLSGSPREIVEDLQAYVAAGVQHFVLDFSVPTLPEMRDVLERFAVDVRPQVGGAP